MITLHTRVFQSVFCQIDELINALATKYDTHSLAFAISNALTNGSITRTLYSSV